jgi:hypothetical protein
VRARSSREHGVVARNWLDSRGFRESRATVMHERATVLLPHVDQEMRRLPHRRSLKATNPESTTHAVIARIEPSSELPEELRGRRC